MNWVAKTAGSSGRPSVVSMSLGGYYLASVDATISSLFFSGVTVVVSASNGNIDASDYSPANNSYAITVGATTIYDAKASYSNYGVVLDIWAPGAWRIGTPIPKLTI
jgi:cerevisin